MEHWFELCRAAGGAGEAGGGPAASHPPSGRYCPVASAGILPEIRADPGTPAGRRKSGHLRGQRPCSAAQNAVSLWGGCAAHQRQGYIIWSITHNLPLFLPKMIRFSLLTHTYTLLSPRSYFVPVVFSVLPFTSTFSFVSLKKKYFIPNAIGWYFGGFYNIYLRTNSAKGLGSSRLPGGQSGPPPLEALQTAEKRILQLSQERDYWRTHFILADKRAASLSQQLRELKTAGEKSAAVLHALPAPLKAVDLNSTDQESLFVRNLLKENVELKEELTRLSGSGPTGVKKSVSIQDVAKDGSRSAPAGYASQKENLALGRRSSPPIGNAFRGRPTNGHVPAPGHTRPALLPVDRQPSGVWPPGANTNRNNRFPRPGVTQPRPRLPPPATRPPSPRPPAPCVARHSHTTDCRAQCCGARECDCATCSDRLRAQGLQTELHRLTEQNTCLQSQVERHQFLGTWQVTRLRILWKPLHPWCSCMLIVQLVYR